MNGRRGSQIDWAAFLRTPALSYLILTLVIVILGLAYLLLRAM